MFKKILISKIAIMMLSSVFAQSNNVYIEGLGAGFSSTLNYERMLTDKIAARIGYMSGAVEDEDGHDHGDDKVTFMPLGVSYLMGSGNHKLEVGGGMTMINGHFDAGSEDEIEANANMTFIGGGYRYQRGTGGFLFGVNGYYLTLGPLSLPWVGFKLGWTF